MAFTIKLPPLGEGIFEAQVVNLRFSEGDKVEQGDIIADMQTDKAAGELASPVNGTIDKFLVREGDLVFRNNSMIVIDDGSAKDTSGSGLDAADQKESTSKTKKIKKKKEETSKPAAQEKSVSEEKAKSPKVKRDEPILAMPYVYEYAKEKGVSLSNVPAGEDGITRIENVDYVFEHSVEETEIDLGYPDQYNPGYLTHREDEEAYREQTYIRKYNSSTMEMSHNIIPTFSIFEEVNAEKLLEYHKEFPTGSEEGSFNNSFLPYVMKALVTAGKRYPTLNASLDDTLARYVFKSYFNVGFEVNTVQGLFTPVVRNVDQKSMMEIKDEIEESSNEVNQGIFHYEKLSEGTMSISDISSIGQGGGHFVPIIHYPEVVNLGIGKVKEKPIAENGAVKIKPMLPISLVVDNRVVDRADAVNTINFLKELLEKPSMLLYKG